MSACLLNAWQAINSRLAGLDFGAVWPGSEPFGFALYNREFMCLDGQMARRDGRFFGNTAIRLEDRVIAIWSLDEEARDWDALVASLAHEMFHAHQITAGESRYPEDLKLLQYPQHLRAYELKAAENALLAEPARTGKEALERLAAIKALRRARKELLGEHLLQEYRAETIEGSAVYAELRALTQLNITQYDNRIADCRAKLSVPGPLLFDIRRCAYYTGALLIDLAVQAGLEGFQIVGREERTLFELMEAGIQDDAAPDIPENTAVEARMKDYTDSVRAQIDGFLEGGPAWQETPANIVGYDPMNMIRREDLLLVKTIVMLDTGQGGEPLTLEGPILLQMALGSPDRALRYARQA
ncbi:MAG: hypothetical protein GXY84_08410 [Clostridiales bacterium]|nr:hypothetical protein [Clostridiales bacterium]